MRRPANLPDNESDFSRWRPKYAWWSLGCLGVALFAAAFVVGGIVRLSTEPPSPSEQRLGDLPAEHSRTIALHLTAQELGEVYLGNQAAADMHCTGKTIAVTGTVRGVERDDGVYLVRLRATLAAYGRGVNDDIICGCSQAEAAALRIGETATLEGECRGLVKGWVVVAGCRVTDHMMPKREAD